MSMVASVCLIDELIYMAWGFNKLLSGMEATYLLCIYAGSLWTNVVLAKDRQKREKRREKEGRKVGRAGVQCEGEAAY